MEIKCQAPHAIDATFRHRIVLADLLLGGHRSARADGCRNGRLAGWWEAAVARRRSLELRAPLGELARAADNARSTAPGQPCGAAALLGRAVIS